MSLARRIAAWLGHDLRPLHKSDALKLHLARYFDSHRIDLLVDCGAFIGTFAKTCRAAGYAGEILSFEPSPRQFEALAAAAADDPLWSAERSGLGHRSGEATMHVSSGAGDLNSLYVPGGELKGHIRGLDAVEDVKVRIDRLDEVLARRSVAGDAAIFLKSDTQGHDLEVLRGAGERLGQVRALVLEMSVQPLYRGTPSHWQVLEFVRDAGFEPYGFSSLARDPGGALIEYDALFIRRDVRGG